jgi:hypothetical protein
MKDRHKGQELHSAHEDARRRKIAFFPRLLQAPLSGLLRLLAFVGHGGPSG